MKGLTDRADSLFIHHVCHVGAADERAAEYHLESDGETVVAIGVELRGRDVLGHLQIAARRLEVLTDGGDVGAGGEEIAEELLDFVGLFSEADHESGFGRGIAGDSFSQIG